MTHDSNFAITSPKCLTDDNWETPGSGKRIETYILDEKKTTTPTVFNQVDLYSNDQKKPYNRVLLNNLNVPDHERIGVYSTH